MSNNPFQSRGINPHTGRHADGWTPNRPPRTNEAAELRYLAAQQGYQLRKDGEAVGRYLVGDENGPITSSVTGSEVRKWLAGLLGLGQLRQPPR